MELARVALLVQFATTLPLVGLIWIVQIVSYPLFARVGATEFPAYHAGHSGRITCVVAPLMVLELAAALAGVFFLDGLLSIELATTGAALAISVWLLTMFVSVPQHRVLAHGFDARAHRLLVTGNWLRTIAWTLRGALLLWVAARA